MTSTDLQPAHRSGTPTCPDRPATRGPFRRIVVGSLTFSAVSAVGLTVGPLTGGVEHLTTGVLLLAFSAGWAMLAGLTIRMTNRPQRWGVRARRLPGSQRSGAGDMFTRRRRPHRGGLGVAAGPTHRRDLVAPADACLDAGTYPLAS